MNTKIVAGRKWIVSFSFLAYTFMPYTSKAIGLATGPSFGMGGFYTSFESKKLSQKISISNVACQMGWFTKLDLGLLYVKLDGLFVLNWRKLPDALDRKCFKDITLPITIGVPFFGLLRPHIGLVFLIPLNSLDRTCFQCNALIERYREKINGYILGFGIDLGKVLIDVCYEFAWSTVTRKSISPDLLEHHKDYRPKKINLRVGYNLFW